MTDAPKLVLDTNIVISALLWNGRPGEILTLARDETIMLHSSPTLLRELREILQRPKLAKATTATGLSTGGLYRRYRRIATLTHPAPLDRAYSRDPDDDHVIACALTAHADYIISGDDDLLSLDRVGNIPILSPAAFLATVASSLRP
jgi:putative PIN family toxin of toxin-antitoxin system